MSYTELFDRGSAINYLIRKFSVFGLRPLKHYGDALKGQADMEESPLYDYIRDEILPPVKKVIRNVGEVQLAALEYVIEQKEREKSSEILNRIEQKRLDAYAMIDIVL